jgi:hypothetical protein
MLPLRHLTALLVVAALSACGGGGGGEDEAKAGLTQATQACNQALAKQRGASDDEVLVRDKATADLAAQAADANAKWRDLARAVSDWALTGQDLIEATKKLQSGGDITSELSEVGTRVDDARRSLVAACRGVKAAGGAVSEESLNDI